MSYLNRWRRWRRNNAVLWPICKAALWLMLLVLLVLWRIVEDGLDNPWILIAGAIGLWVGDAEVEKTKAKERERRKRGGRKVAHKIGLLKLTSKPAMAAAISKVLMDSIMGIVADIEACTKAANESAENVAETLLNLPDKAAPVHVTRPSD